MTSNLRRLCAVTIVLFAGALIAGSARADAKEDAAKKQAAAHEAAMAEMMKYAAPGKAHAALKPMEGKFKAVVKSWYVPGEPQTSEGTMDNQLILGGRYLEGRFTGTMNGQPFEGVSLTGFDNKTQKLWSIWIDNSSTSGMTMSGTMSDDGKVMTSTGMADGPDGKPMEYKCVTKVTDDKTHVFTMNGMMAGKEVPGMEITYTRMPGSTTASE